MKNFINEYWGTILFTIIISFPITYYQWIIVKDDFDKADSLMAKHQFKEAIEIYDKYKDNIFDNISSGAHYQKLFIYYNIRNYKDYKKVQILSEKLIDINPEKKEKYLGILSTIYMRGNYGINKNFDKAYNYIKDYQNSNDPAIQCNMGYMYEKGLNVGKNIDKALVLYEKSANQGYAPCQHNMGIVYFDGIGVNKDYTKAYKWIKKANNQDFGPSAAYNLKMLCKGLGTKSDSTACDALNKAYQMLITNNYIFKMIAKEQGKEHKDVDNNIYKGTVN